MRPTSPVICLAAAFLVAGCDDGDGGRAPVVPLRPGAGDGDGGARGAADRLPQFPPVRSDEERIARWIEILESGDDEDVEWAVSRIATAGEPGRRALRDAATKRVASNPAFLGQSLEFLLREPASGDADLAVAALASIDPQAADRAIRLLAALPGTRSEAEVAAIESTALARGTVLRLTAIAALAKIGTAPAAAAALRLADSAPPGELAAATRALGAVRHPSVTKALAERFTREADLDVRFALADALVTLGDPSPVAWLESLLASPPQGTLDYGTASLGILAKTKHRGALARIGAIAADPLAGAGAVTAIQWLGSYPLEDTIAFLDAAAGNADRDVRIEALDALWKARAPGTLERLLRLVREGDAEAASSAALVLGRIRRPEAAGALRAAFERKDLDETTRTFQLRALVLSGDPDSAEFVARTIAGDHVPYDALESVAYNAGAMLGDASPEFRGAMGRQLARALAGEFGKLSGAGLVQTIRAAGIACGPEAAPLLAPFAGHEDAAVRSNAALALGYVAGEGTERDLRAAWWRASDPVSRQAIERAIERAHYRATR